MVFDVISTDIVDRYFSTAFGVGHLSKLSLYLNKTGLITGGDREKSLDMAMMNSWSWRCTEVWTNLQFCIWSLYSNFPV